MRVAVLNLLAAVRSCEGHDVLFLTTTGESSEVTHTFGVLK